MAITTGSCDFLPAPSPNCNNGTTNNVFLWDQATRSISLISATATGQPSNGYASTDAQISANGRYVAYTTPAADIPVTRGVPGNMYRYDTVTHRTIRFAMGYHPSISSTGQFIAFTKDDGNVYRYDVRAQSTRLVSASISGGAADGPSTSAPQSISADGRFVAFQSSARNLTATPPANNDTEIYLWDATTNSSTLVSRSSTGGAAPRKNTSPAVSGDGRIVAYVSNRRDLAPNTSTTTTNQIYVYDVTLGTTVRITTIGDGNPAATSRWPAISRDGHFIAFDEYPGDQPPADHIYRYDRVMGSTVRVSSAPDGSAENTDSILPVISADGRHVAFTSFSTNLTGGYDGQHDGEVYVWSSP